MAGPGTAAVFATGPGAVMRSAPCGFLPIWDPPEDEFRCECATAAAGYTHRRPTSQLAARGLAHIIEGATLHDTVRRCPGLDGDAFRR